MSILSAGLSDVTVLGVFSTTLPGTFVIPRTLDATAILFKEPGSFLSARQKHYTPVDERSCKKTIIPLGKIKRKFQPAIDKSRKFGGKTSLDFVKILFTLSISYERGPAHLMADILGLML